MDTEEIRSIYETMQQFLNERDKRLLVAAMAKIEGYGGISKVSKETGLSRKLISKGCFELDNPTELDTTRIRKTGAGRKKITDTDPTLLTDLNEIEWLQAAAANPAFDFLKDSEEDIYTFSDGRPFDDLQGD